MCLRFGHQSERLRSVLELEHPQQRRFFQALGSSAPHPHEDLKSAEPQENESAEPGAFKVNRP